MGTGINLSFDASVLILQAGDELKKNLKPEKRRIIRGNNDDISEFYSLFCLVYCEGVLLEGRVSANQRKIVQLFLSFVESSTMKIT